MKKKKNSQQNAIISSEIREHSDSLKSYYLPVLLHDLPESAQNISKPIHLLGAAGGVGVTTIARIINEPLAFFDYGEIDSRRQFIKYLPDVVLVANYTYSSLLHLQGILQQISTKASFKDVDFKPRLQAIVINDNVNSKPTKATMQLLKYLTTGIDNVIHLPFCIGLQDVDDFNTAGLPKAYYKNIAKLMKIINNPQDITQENNLRYKQIKNPKKKGKK